MTSPTQTPASRSRPRLVSALQSITAGRGQCQPSPIHRPTLARSAARSDLPPDAGPRVRRPRPAPQPRTGISQLGRAAARVAVPAAVAAVLVLAVPSAAVGTTSDEAAGEVAVLAANSLPQVITNLQNWLIGILAAIATLFAVLAGVYWATAGGDPAQVERAKGALRNALIGYGAAVLAPVFLQIVRGIVGG